MGFLDDGAPDENHVDIPKGSKWSLVPLYIGLLITGRLSFISIEWGAFGFYVITLCVCVPLCALVHEYEMKKNRSSIRR